MALGHVLPELEVIHLGFSAMFGFAPISTGYRTVNIAYGGSTEEIMPQIGQWYEEFIIPSPFFRVLLFIWFIDGSAEALSS